MKGFAESVSESGGRMEQGMPLSEEGKGERTGVLETCKILQPIPKDIIDQC